MRRLYAAGWLLLVIFTDSGLPKHGGEYETKAECIEAWTGIAKCFAKDAAKAKQSGKECFLQCGQPIGYCVQGERLNAPGVIFPLPKKESTCD